MRVMDSQVRVVHVINSLGAGGAELSLAEMLPPMRESGVESTVVCLSPATTGVTRRVWAGGFPVRLVGPGRVKALAGIRRIVGDLQPDIVHTTIYDADILGRLAAAGRPPRVLTSLVSTTYDGVRLADSSVSPFKLAAAKFVDRVTAGYLTDHFHAISPAVKASAVHHLHIPQESVTVVERGRDLGRLGTPSPERRKRVRNVLDVAQEAPVVVSIGRQEYSKGHHTLLRALARLAPARPDLVLLHAGRRGKASKDLELALADLGLSGVARFLGHREDVGDLLAAADVFAFPSVYEGLGGSLLEAMAMRVPAVVSDIPPLAEVTQNGLGAAMVPVGDDVLLAAAIGRLLDDPALARAQAERARQIFDARFTLERSVEGMVDLYHQVMERGAP